MGEAPSCTCGEGTFPMLWPLSCCRAGTQPVGGQRGMRTDRIRPMTMQMLQPCYFQATGSRWGLGRQPPFKNVHVQGCFERSVCKDGLKWKAADTMASPGCRGSHGGGLLSSAMGSRKDPDCPTAEPVQGCDVRRSQFPSWLPGDGTKQWWSPHTFLVHISQTIGDCRYLAHSTLKHLTSMRSWTLPC